MADNLASSEQAVRILQPDVRQGEVGVLFKVLCLGSASAWLDDYRSVLLGVQTSGVGSSEGKATAKAEMQARLRHGSITPTFADRVFQNDMSILASSAFQVPFLLLLCAIYPCTIRCSSSII